MPEPPELPDDGPASAPRLVLGAEREVRLCRMSAAEYHADPCVVPSLSSSIAHVLDEESPMHAHARHPRFGGVKREDTKAFDSGTLSHALLLGQGEEIGIVDAGDWRTKAAKAERELHRAAGRVPVLLEDFEHAKAVADTLRQRFAELKDQHGNPTPIILDGESEVTALWCEEVNGSFVQCRAMIDHLKLPIATIYDLKSCASAKPDRCQLSANKYGYDIQNTAYVSAIEHNRPDLLGRMDFVFLFYEIEEPFAVTPLRLSGEFRELGGRRWRRSVATWERCLRTNHWPAYAEGITNLEPPRWALANDMEKHNDENL